MSDATPAPEDLPAGRPADRPAGALRRRALLRYGAGALTTGLATAAGVGFAARAAAYGWPASLQQGSTGAAVTELQIRVAGWAADSAAHAYVSVDGDFGPGTAAAVKRFQSAYGLSADGVAGPQTFSALNALESSDGSTAHFEWSEFYSHDGAGFSGGKVSAATVKANVRRLMYKLEAVRKKAGDSPITVNSGFRSVAYNTSIYGYATNSMHQYGITADIVVSGHSTESVYRIGERSGFSGLESYSHSWQHMDSRVEYAYGAQSWWWEDGTV